MLPTYAIANGCVAPHKANISALTTLFEGKTTYVILLTSSTILNPED
jgi:hypothetical protein